MEKQDLAQQLSALGLSPRLDEPLSRHGFWRLGGPADVFVEVGTTSQLCAVRALGVPVTVLGRGSNLLIADAGVRGITLSLAGELRDSHFEPGAVVAGGGLYNNVLLSRLERLDLNPVTALVGIPGTVGGAVRMNAGTTLGEIAGHLLAVELVDEEGGVAWKDASELRFGYRFADLGASIVTRARLRTTPRDPAVVEQAQAHLARRKASQPLDQPSCGSVFKNPPGDHAGRLIQAAGLKGARSGGARISPKHANFIVNTGGATAEDVYALIARVRASVYERFGIVLEPEVHAVGEWPTDRWPLPAVPR